MGSFVDLTGQRFGRWTVLGEFERSPSASYWLCLCDCGTKKRVQAGHLRQGASISCGCIRSERLAARQKTHGRSKTKTYRIWKGMRRRCYQKSNPAYPRYGGRGITVCKRWAKFENFLADMGEVPAGRMSLDRINNNGNYSPSNCRWACDKIQANNSRNNRIVRFRRKNWTAAQFASLFPHLKYTRVVYLLNKGFSPNQIYKEHFK